MPGLVVKGCDLFTTSWMRLKDVFFFWGINSFRTLCVAFIVIITLIIIISIISIEKSIFQASSWSLHSVRRRASRIFNALRKFNNVYHPWRYQMASRIFFLKIILFKLFSNSASKLSLKNCRIKGKRRWYWEDYWINFVESIVKSIINTPR